MKPHAAVKMPSCCAPALLGNSPVIKNYLLGPYTLQVVPDVDGYAVRVYDAVAEELTYLVSNVSMEVATANALNFATERWPS